MLVLAWRVVLDKLPTMLELRKQDIMLKDEIEKKRYAKNKM